MTVVVYLLTFELIFEVKWKKLEVLEGSTVGCCDEESRILYRAPLLLDTSANLFLFLLATK